MVKAFTELGSQFIAQLGFRDLWAFVGQRGIVGTSPIEQVALLSQCPVLLTLPGVVVRCCIQCDKRLTVC